METFDCFELVLKLIGPVLPVGEACQDERRLESLKKLCELHDKITFYICLVAGPRTACFPCGTKSEEFAREYLQKLSESFLGVGCARSIYAPSLLKESEAKG